MYKYVYLFGGVVEGSVHMWEMSVGSEAGGQQL